MESQDEILTMLRRYFKYLDMPPGWGFGKEKKDAEKALRKYLKEHRPTKRMVKRRWNGTG